MEFSPAILAKTESEFREKVESVRLLGLPLHVDVMDGEFVPQVAWAHPVEVQEIAGDMKFEAHLMVSDPEHSAIIWLAVGARRVWIHVEATPRAEMILRAAGKEAYRLGLVINPETPLSQITPLLDKFQSVLVMGVNPGRSGQEFQAIALDKIKQLKELRPNLWVKVDGGVNVGNVAAIARAGADAVASASGLTDQPVPALALEEMRRRLTPAGADAETAKTESAETASMTEPDGTPPVGLTEPPLDAPGGSGTDPLDII